jgi:putative flavoprotein involved in K+ transport
MVDSPASGVTCGDLWARQVVVATGSFQVPFVPPAAGGFDVSVTQIHSPGYRNLQALPDGRVLVVGGGNSGLQIAEELAQTRRVDVSVGGNPPMLPQRLLRRDVFWWLTRLGFMRVSTASLFGRPMQRRGEFLIGTSRGRLKRAGVGFRARLVAAQGCTARFADGGDLDVAVVVWATGYHSDYSWITIPGVVRDGHVVHRQGPRHPGLYFLGLSWQHTRGSALLGFVADAAAYVADQIAGRLADHRTTQLCATAPRRTNFGSTRP